MSSTDTSTEVKKALKNSFDFESLFKSLSGPMGIMGWEGRSPIHVQDETPTEDVQKGDLWYQPETEKVSVYTGRSWKQLLKQGIMGLEGEKGETGEVGDIGSPGKDGKNGKDGRDGKDADITQVVPIVDKQIEKHEKKFDHTLIDPFLVGTKKIDEAGLSDGMVIQYDAKANRLIYAKPKAQKASLQGGGGTSLPPRSSSSGKFLKTVAGRLVWADASSSGGIARTVTSVAVDTTAGSDSNTDYVYLCSGTMTLTMPTAVGNTNLYTIKNVGVGTITIAFTGGQTGDGSATMTLPVRYTSVDLVSNNSNWSVT